MKQITMRLLLSCILNMGIGCAALPVCAAQGGQIQSKSFIMHIPTFIKRYQEQLFCIALVGVFGYLAYYHPALFIKKDPSQNPVNKPAPEQRECPICFEDKDVTQCSRLSCTHTFCTECLMHMTNNAMRERTTAQLRCPECQQPIAKQDIRTISQNNKDILDRREDIMVQEWLKQQPNVKYCKTPDCPFAFIDEQPDQRRSMQCPQCKHNYCSQCLFEHSLTVTCAEAEEHHALRQDRNKVDRATEDWKRQHAKPCPQCRMPIQRTEGCDYMKCTACNHQFCWNCLKPHDHNMAAHRCG